jgi:ABC-type multidrug transport system fused ATPase/permease subunit
MLTTYLRPQRGRVALLSVLLLSSIGLQLINPQIVRYFIDQATAQVPAGGAIANLVGVALLYIGVALVTQAVTVGATYLGEKVGWSATNKLSSDLARHCLRLDMPFHNVRTPGEMIERIDGDVIAISKFFSQFVIQIVGSALLMIGVLVLLFLEDWRVGAALTIFTLVAVVALARIRNVAVPAITADREAQAQLFGFVEEQLAGLDDVRANGGGNYVMRRFHEMLRNVFHKGRRGIMLGSTIWVVTMGLFGLGYALALGLGGFLYLRGAVTIGTVYLFYDYVYLLHQPIQQVAEQLKEFQKAMAGMQRVKELRSYTPQIVDGRGPKLQAGPLEVTFDHVSFAYHADAHVLHDVTLTLRPGHVLGLLGRTGSGKTTMTRLLFRLYETDAGAIRLNGTDIRDTQLADLRERIGIVTQDVQLFQATVRDNLTLFDSGVSDEQILGVIDDLGLQAWLYALPNGLDTELATGGSGVSAGEAQLLAFARIFLKDPGLVILDEASSRLDPATEQLIEQAVDKLLQNRTAIIIAHRLTTVQRADEILILDHGRVEEYGSRAELASNGASRFAELLRTGGVAEVLAS